MTLHRLSPFAGIILALAIVNPGAGVPSLNAGETAAEADPGEAMDTHIGNHFATPVGGAVFHPTRSKLWITGGDSGSVIQWDFETGTLERRWRVAGMPRSLALTPDGTRLYATVTKGFAPNGEPLNGSVAEIDTVAGVLTRQFPLDIPPLDLVATDDGYFIVSSEDSLSSPIQVHRSDSGELTGVVSGGFFKKSRLFLSPSQRILYTLDDWTQRDIVRYDFSSFDGTLIPRTSAAANNPPGTSIATGSGIYAWPSGRSIITGAGQRLTAFRTPAEDLRLIEPGSGLFPDGVAAVPDRNGVVLLQRRIVQGMVFVSDPDLAILGQRKLASSGLGRAMTVRSNVIYAAVDSGPGFPSGLSLERVLFPARTPEQNLPPVVFMLNPAVDLVHAMGRPFPLRVQAADEDGTVTNLLVTLDGETLAESAGTDITKAILFPEKRTYTIQAVATDNFGVTTSSAPVVVRLSDPPVATLLRPPPGEVIQAPATVEFEISARDPDGSVRRVEFYFGTHLLGAATAPPYTLTVPNLTTYSDLRVIVEDDIGVRVESKFPYGWIGMPGDDFALPFVLTGSPATARTSNREASGQRGDPFSNGGKTIWWQWVAPTNGILTLSTAGSSFDTGLGVFVVTNQTSRLQLAWNDDGPGVVPASFLKVAVTNGGDYRMVVDAIPPSNGGDIALSLEFKPLADADVGAALPPNDDYARRAVLTGSNASVLVNNSGATREPGEPLLLPQDRGGRSVWWEWTSPGPGLVTLSTSGSALDTVLGVYAAGATVGELQAQFTNDDDPRGGPQSLLQFATRANERWAIGVDGFAGQGGEVQLHLTFEPLTETTRPVNDEFADRIPLTGSSLPVLASHLGARRNPEEPSFESRPVWWTWTAAANQRVVVSTVGSTFDTDVSVYVGDRLDSLQRVAFGRDSFKGPFVSTRGETQFLAVAGETYQIAVGNGNSGSDPTGAITLFVRADDPLPPIPLSISPQNPPAILGLRPSSTSTGRLLLLSSTNLHEWRVIQTNDLGPDVVFPVNSGSSTQEFFRAVLLP